MQRTMRAAVTALAMLAATGAQALDSKEPPKAAPPMQKILDAYAALDVRPLAGLTPAEARRQATAADAVARVLRDDGKAPPNAAALAVKHRSAPGPAGPVPLHVYAPPGKGPFPVLVYFHGGGFVLGDTKAYEPSIRALAQGAHAVVVSVDYRQAPEHRFPAAADDAFAAWRWVVAHAQDLNGDPTRVAVAGEGAGGNLAAVVALMARDRKVQAPLHQVLIYPVVGDDMSTPSYQRNANARPLDKASMQWFLQHYASAPADRENPYALPLKAGSLKGLAPATVVAAEIDPLASEAKAYADRLQADGVAVRYREFDGVTHEFFGMQAALPKAEDAQKFVIEDLVKAFAARPGAEGAVARH
ncbi:alpha/beta hydrolase [[Empedobacter] haloabium]|uniref:Alpha/beta hydrolase n=1 Tax=[Empedobacter] haloabium TaxID=592317 RepID=A0ABZ1UWE4_9BURK